MVLLWILLGLVTIILILCFCPVTLFVNYIDGELDYNLKYLVFKIVKPGEKKHKKRKDKHNKKSRDLNNKKESSKKEDATAVHPYIEESLTIKKEMKNKNPKPKGKKKRRKLGSKAEGLKNDGLELTEKIKLIKDIISASGKGLKGILKAISIRDVFIDFIISDEDAYECAMKYGKINILIYNILGFISSYFKVSKSSISVTCKFNEKDSKYNFSFKIKLRLGTAIVSFVGMVLTYFMINRKSISKRKKIKNKIIHES